MDQRNQARPQGAGSSDSQPPAPPPSDPLETSASHLPRLSRFEQLMVAYKALCCTDEETNTTADGAIALNDLNANQSSPAGPSPNETSTNAEDEEETTKISTPIRNRFHRLFSRPLPGANPLPRLNLLPKISIPSSLSRLSTAGNSSKSQSGGRSRKLSLSSFTRSHFSAEDLDYDPYTVRGTTPPILGPRDFSCTSTNSNIWRRAQQQQEQQRQRRRAASDSGPWRPQRPQTRERGGDGGDQFAYGYERTYGRGYAYGHGNGSGSGGGGGERAAASGGRGCSNARNTNNPTTSRGRSRSDTVMTTALPRLHGPQPLSLRAQLNEEAPASISNHHDRRNNANLDRTRTRSRSVLPSPTSSIYSTGTTSEESLDDTCSCCCRRNADEEADKADRANNHDDINDNDDDVEAIDFASSPYYAAHPTPGMRPNLPSRSHSHASSLALRRWDASHPGSPYPSSFRPGLAALATNALKRQRARRAARLQRRKEALEEAARIAAAPHSADLVVEEDPYGTTDSDTDSEYAAALASIDAARAKAKAAKAAAAEARKARKTRAKALLSDGADEDGAYAAALASMPLPSHVPMPMQTDAVVSGAIAALRARESASASAPAVLMPDDAAKGDPAKTW
ncbi:hypothetical protein IWX47DRAFT_908724 [Phyllosticta citricarpa]|uniref:Uncharacterized protein n=1 Tax=Phyllosticta citricarpa TaxID=55181 RepID=A0ABR1LRQ1_9PEZI